MRIPFFERVQRIDKRVLDLDMQRQQVLSTDQLRLEVDAYARYRIIDPVKLVRTVGTVENVELQLSPIFSSVLRQELGRRSFASLLTAERGTDDAQYPRHAGRGGARIRRAGDRRADQARRFAARHAAAIGVHPDADRARAGGDDDPAPAGSRRRRSSAPPPMPRPRGSTPQSFGKDPDFYDFYRAMQSYEATFGSTESQSTIILSPDNDYLQAVPGKALSFRPFQVTSSRRNRLPCHSISVQAREANLRRVP